jgi:hypothetical protein
VQQTQQTDGRHTEGDERSDTNKREEATMTHPDAEFAVNAVVAAFAASNPASHAMSHTLTVRVPEPRCMKRLKDTQHAYQVQLPASAPAKS